MKKSKGPCWTGYTMVGMKSKGKKKVPNCVPVKKANKGLLADKEPKSPAEQKPPRIEQQDTPKKFQDTVDKAKKFKNKKPMPGDRDEKRKYMIDIHNPHSEYKNNIKKGKYFKPNQLSYTAAKHGSSIDAGGMSALGRIEKAGMVRGGGAAIKGLNFKGVF
jgi:hypothetical protein